MNLTLSRDNYYTVHTKAYIALNKGITNHGVLTVHGGFDLVSLWKYRIKTA